MNASVTNLTAPGGPLTAAQLLALRETEAAAAAKAGAGGRPCKPGGGLTALAHTKLRPQDKARLERLAAHDRYRDAETGEPNESTPFQEAVAVWLASPTPPTADGGEKETVKTGRRGRPRFATGSCTVEASAGILPAQDAQVEGLARRFGSTPSACVRHAILLHLDRMEEKLGLPALRTPPAN